MQRGRVQCLGDRVPVGAGQAASSQLDATEPPARDGHDVRQMRLIVRTRGRQGVQSRHSGCSSRLAVVAAALGMAIRSDDEGGDVVTGIVAISSRSGNDVTSFFLGLDADQSGSEDRAFDLQFSLDRVRQDDVLVHLTPGREVTMSRRIFSISSTTMWASRF